MVNFSHYISGIPKALDDGEATKPNTLLLFLFILLILFPTGVIDGNETHYFIMADLFWKPQSEFSLLLEQSSYFLVFAFFTNTLIDFLGYELANAALRTISAFFLAFSFSRLLAHWSLSTLDAIIIVSAFLIFDQQFFGDEWIFRGVEGKVVAYACVFLGLSKALEGKWKMMVLSLVIATYFHFLVGGFWTLIAFYWLVSSNKPKALSSNSLLVRAGLFYSVAIAPIIFLVLLQRIDANSVIDGVDTFQIYLDRFSHHIDPFSNIDQLRGWIPGFVSLLGCLLALITIRPVNEETAAEKTLINTLMFLYLYLMFMFVLSASDMFVKSFGAFYVFRPSSLTLLLTITLAVILYRNSQNTRIPIWAVFFIFTPFASWQVIDKKLAESIRYYELKDEVNILVKEIERATRPHEIVLIQPGREGYFPESRLTRLIPRPLLVDNKFVPTTPSNLMEWHKRITFRDNLFSAGCMDAYPVGALIIRNYKPPTNAVLESCGRTVFTGANYSIIDIKP